MINNFYKCNYCDYITSLLIMIISFYFKRNLLITSDLIKIILTFTATLCGFILTSITILTALWNQNSMKMVREARDSEYIYFLPLTVLNRGIFLICIFCIGLFAENLNKNTIFILASIFMIILFFMSFLRFLFLLKTIFKWVLSYKN